MAVSQTRVYSRAHAQVWEVISTADGDTTCTITHARGRIPDEVFLTPRLVGNELWSLDSKSKTNIVLKRTGAGVGSGDPAVQLSVLIGWNERRGA